MVELPISRVVLPLGTSPRPVPPAVVEKVARLLAPWFPRALASRAPMALPFPAAAGFKAQVEESRDGLIARLLRPLDDARDACMAVAAIGVARDAPSARALKRRIARESGVLGPVPDQAPCCLIAPVPVALERFPEVAEWLDEFAEGLAYLWLRLGMDPSGPNYAGALATGTGDFTPGPAGLPQGPPRGTYRLPVAARRSP